MLGSQRRLARLCEKLTMFRKGCLPDFAAVGHGWTDLVGVGGEG